MERSARTSDFELDIEVEDMLGHPPTQGFEAAQLGAGIIGHN